MNYKTLRSLLDEFQAAGVSGHADREFETAIDCVDEILSDTQNTQEHKLALNIARTYLANYLEAISHALQRGQPPSEVLNEFLRVLAILGDQKWELFSGSREIYWEAFNETFSTGLHDPISADSIVRTRELVARLIRNLSNGRV